MYMYVANVLCGIATVYRHVTASDLHAWRGRLYELDRFFPCCRQPFMQPALIAAESSLQSGNGTGDGASPSEEEGEERAESAPSRKRSRSESGPPSPKPQPKKRRASRDSNHGRRQSADAEGQSGASHSGSRSNSAPKVFTFDPQRVQDAETMTNRGTATLDDLCRAVEELEKREQQQQRGGPLEEAEGGGAGDDTKKRPGNIVIPQSHSSPAIERERHRFGATPPYTPPPILSPARSMTMLSSVMPLPQPCTPGRILAPWTSRRSSENTRGPSETEEVYAEPRINIGKEFQAVLPAYDGERPP